jgi:uncharacterized protein YoxC
MSDIKKANQINCDYNGKHYCLEYTRETVKMMEASGFNINDVGDKPATRIEQLWAGAFLAHHQRKVSNTVIKELYDKMKDKDKLLEALTTMYNATLSYLLPDQDEDDEGNVEWTATL